MHLSRLSVSDLRNIRADLTNLGQINIFFGANGSGKTSVLEAIHLLGLGRSFRSPSARSVVRYQAESLTVFAEQTGSSPMAARTRLGLSRNGGGELIMRMNGEPVRGLAQMARQLPLLLVNADTFGLLEGAPRLRRQFLDWGVFHVEQEFYPAWKVAVRCLKHRNSLLRRGKLDLLELDAWDQRLADCAKILHACRERYSQRLISAWRNTLGGLGVEPMPEMHYSPGWDASQSYRDVLSSQRQRDLAQRQTGSGPHRADLVFRVHGHAAADILSRGQKKMAVMALRLAQAELLKADTGQSCLLLLDDLPAELDPGALGRLMAWLSAHDNQAFITSIPPDALPVAEANRNRTRWFHVEQGSMRATGPNGREDES